MTFSTYLHGQHVVPLLGPVCGKSDSLPSGVHLVDEGSHLLEETEGSEGGKGRLGEVSAAVSVSLRASVMCTNMATQTHIHAHKNRCTPTDTDTSPHTQTHTSH